MHIKLTEHISDVNDVMGLNMSALIPGSFGKKCMVYNLY